MIYLSYAVFDKDFAEPLARALVRNDVAVQRDVDCAAKIRKHFSNGPTRSVVIVSEEYLESGWTTVEYKEIVDVVSKKRGVVAVIFLNLDRDRVVEAAARYENGCWDPSWFDNEHVWLLDGRPSPEDAALRIAARIREGWGAVQESPERDQVRALAAENLRLKDQNKSLKLENQSLRAEMRALEELAGPRVSATVGHGAVINVVDNRYIHAHLEEVEQLIRRALEHAEFNEGLTVDRTIWHTKTFGARLDRFSPCATSSPPRRLPTDCEQPFCASHLHPVAPTK
ncbi:MAG: TIR domain-containing protein [Polyangiaceae bacterium]